MFQRAKSFVRNHWKKAVFGGIAIQVAAYGFRYATDRFLIHQENQAIQYWQKVKKQQYFENVDQNCIATFRQLYDVMKMKIGEVLNAEDLQERLKTNQLVTNKLEAWNELKVIAFTRVLVTIYGSSILYVFLRIQLSMVGGYLIKGCKTDNDPLLGGSRSNSSSTRSLAGSNSRGMDEDAQRKYLELSQYFVSTGIVKICQYIEHKVKNVIHSVSLKQTISAGDLEQIFWTIIRRKESAEEINEGDGDHVPAAAQTNYDKYNPTKYPWKYVFPDELIQNPEFFNGNVESDPIESSNLYRKLVCETFDLLESEDVLDILSYFESQGVSYCIDRISESMGENVSDVSASIENEDPSVLFEPRAAVAKLIPTMTSLHLIDVLDDPWINLLANADNVKIMSANIYEAFCVE